MITEQQRMKINSLVENNSCYHNGIKRGAQSINVVEDTITVWFESERDEYANIEDCHVELEDDLLGEFDKLCDSLEENTQQIKDIALRIQGFK